MAWTQDEDGGLHLDKESAEFFASVVNAQVRQTQDATNAVVEGLQAQVERWKNEYLWLFKHVELVQGSVDSHKLQKLLDRVEPTVEEACSPEPWETDALGLDLS